MRSSPSRRPTCAFRITPANTDVIEDAARWVTSQPELSPDGKVGMVGISFSGGLSIVAAGRAPLRDRVAFVMSFGGHGDLARDALSLLRPHAEPPPIGRPAAWSPAPTRSDKPPHDYGVTVVLLTFADRFVPAAQVAPLRAAIPIYLLPRR